MPATQRGSVRRLKSGKLQLRYYDNDGKRQNGGVFDTKSAAFEHYRTNIEPRLNGESPAAPDLTVADLADVYLDRHAQIRSESTVRTLRHRLRRPLDTYGHVTLRELEGMSGSKNSALPVTGGAP